MLLVVDFWVSSAKLPATLLMMPLPPTLVALAKAMPPLVFVESSKPEAPVTAVVSAVSKPLNVVVPTVPRLAPVRLNVVLPRPVIAPVPVTLVALANFMPRLLLSEVLKPAAPVTVAASAAVKSWNVMPPAVPVVVPPRANVLLTRPDIVPVPDALPDPESSPPTNVRSATFVSVPLNVIAPSAVRVKE